MGGCASLLQSWAWFRMPFIAPISRVPPTFPLVCQWSGGRVLNYRNVPHNDLVGYRARIDHMQQNQPQEDSVYYVHNPYAEASSSVAHDDHQPQEEHEPQPSHVEEPRPEVHRRNPTRNRRRPRCGTGHHYEGLDQPQEDSVYYVHNPYAEASSSVAHDDHEPQEEHEPQPSHVEEPRPELRRRNPTRNRHQPRCGTGHHYGD
ncbi:hypothetical protein DEO72_LG8g1 [Vigna unguiculata]|uniref:Uncharacterized protein n=1 Tax=Vigna unguiculata TaxID=3917 RepID=A0A4D6MKB4_VIGUN|nr:hypothetical protein DEO72_LG8g1 [Vigna unguiculata]